MQTISDDVLVSVDSCAIEMAISESGRDLDGVRDFGAGHAVGAEGSEADGRDTASGSQGVERHRRGINGIRIESEGGVRRVRDHWERPGCKRLQKRANCIQK
jgi:hypothetical protein